MIASRSLTFSRRPVVLARTRPNGAAEGPESVSNIWNICNAVAPLSRRAHHCSPRIEVLSGILSSVTFSGVEIEIFEPENSPPPFNEDLDCLGSLYSIVGAT